MVFPTKNDHFGVFWGYHHLRKHPYDALENHVVPCQRRCMSYAASMLRFFRVSKEAAMKVTAVVKHQWCDGRMAAQRSEVKENESFWMFDV